ncbi:MAG: capD1 [Paenibacillus sp.]|jgi:gamma-glutamyltranspeptidase/glutathione hydrolase|nr:capD1 [Paenibacillus sp.]
MGERQYGVSAAHPLAVEAGLSVLKSGGNAVDAAIAVSYMLGVVEPYASGIGGGGVMLIFPESGQEPVVCDYREVAPMSGIVSMEEVGVPGFVKGMQGVHERFGSIDLRILLDPAIKAAEEGIPVGEALHRQLMKVQHVQPENFPEFFPEGTAVQPGEPLKQPLLAQTLRAIQEHGSDWFYQGELAREISSIVDGMKESDFQNYKISFKQPLYSEYDNYDLITCPPPFGGVSLIQALKMSEALGLHTFPQGSVPHVHLWGEIMSKCYALRSTTLGDPDFYDFPSRRLISREYMNPLVESIRLDQSSEAAVTMGDVGNTTHFAIVDRDGMLVSTTNTIGGFFGPGIAAGGFFLNNQLRNFSSNVDSPNACEPGKRPQSFACPTILRNHQQSIVIGSAGGKRIPMTMSIILENMVKRDKGIEEAVAAPRFFIDEKVVQTEHKLQAEVEEKLIRLDYEVVHNPDTLFYGGVHGLKTTHAAGQVWGAADPRRGGSWGIGKY